MMPKSVHALTRHARVAGLGLGVLAGALTAATAAAQPVPTDLRGSARAVWQASQDAVVTLQVVMKVTASFGGRQMPAEEIRGEIAATLIDPRGLAVVSLTSIDPGGLFKQMMPKVPGAAPEIESTLSEAKLRLGDGREIAVEVVLRDADLDLAFLRPTEPPSAPLPFVDLSKDASVDVLDEVVVLSRLGKVTSWAPAVVTDRVRAKVAKPRPYLVLASQDFSQEPGQPVFAPSGALVGILAVRSAQADAGGGMMAMSMAMARPGNLLRVVVPAAEIRDVARQATAKP